MNMWIFFISKWYFVLAILNPCSAIRADDSGSGSRIMENRVLYKPQNELPGMASFCQTHADGRLHPDPEDCLAYIYCSGGYAYRATCGKGLFFNHDTLVCDYNFGQCRGGGVKKTEAVMPPAHTDHAEQKTFVTGQPRDNPRIENHYGPPVMKKMTRNENMDDNNIPIYDDSGHMDFKEAYCFDKVDGPYPHPSDCNSYVQCSNGFSIAVRCPADLVYFPDKRGCDYDRNSMCPKSQRVPERSAKQHYGNFHEGLENVGIMLPEAVERAMDSLMLTMRRGSGIARSMKGRSRPFRMVQQFLRTDPMARYLSMPGFIIENASSILIDEFDLKPGKSKRLLESLGSPLSANVHRLQPDDPFPMPEPGSCPWPTYSCQGNEKYRTHDGSCNNVIKPLWGRSFTPLQRFLDPVYEDGVQQMKRSVKGSKLPSPRLVSFTINEDRDVPHHLQSAMMLQFGQFLDHDYALTSLTQLPAHPDGTGKPVDIECGSDGCSTDIEACHPIPVPKNDPDFKDKKCLEFVRSQGVPNLQCSMGPREQVNQLTSFIDVSNVYGSTKEEALKLRDLSDPRRGRLRSKVNQNNPTGKHILPTTDEDEFCNENNEKHCFLAGDERVNEQAALTSMHTLWMREHNRIEEILNDINPHWDGDTLYYETRKILGALFQHMAFNEFLPVVLGPEQMEKFGLKLLSKGFYRGYDSSVNPSIASAFATAAYRFGHSFLIPKFHRMNDAYETLSTIQMSETFFRPSRLMDEGMDGIDGMARGLCASHVQTVDRFITKEVTNKLFSEHPPMGLGLDLVSLNIQRGRDHGLPGYNLYREWCGLGKARNFDELVDTPPDVQRKFREIYRHVDDIDLFPGGISERPVSNGLLGPTFSCILGNQFRALRMGDRFWYENDGPGGFTEAQLKEIRKATLAKLVCNNGDNISEIQPNVMQVPFRVAYPDKRQPRESSLPSEWFSQLWNTNYNNRVNCSCIADIDFTKWRARYH